MIFKIIDADKIPMFGSPLFLENKTMIAKVDEIFGRVDNPVCFLIDYFNMELFNSNII